MDPAYYPRLSAWDVDGGIVVACGSFVMLGAAEARISRRHREEGRRRKL